MEKEIQLSNIEEVKEFVTIANEYDLQTNLLTDRYKIDAKSIMGIFSLDLTQPIRLEVEDGEKTEQFLSEIDRFIMK